MHQHHRYRSAEMAAFHWPSATPTVLEDRSPKNENCHLLNSRVVSNLYDLLSSLNTNGILKNADVQTTLDAIDVHCLEKKVFKMILFKMSTKV